MSEDLPRWNVDRSEEVRKGDSILARSIRNWMQEVPQWSDVAQPWTWGTTPYPPSSANVEGQVSGTTSHTETAATPRLPRNMPTESCGSSTSSSAEQQKVQQMRTTTMHNPERCDGDCHGVSIPNMSNNNKGVGEEEWDIVDIVESKERGGVEAVLRDLYDYGYFKQRPFGYK